MADLLFKAAPPASGNLVFGAGDGPVTGDSTLLVLGRVGDLSGSVFIGGGKLPAVFAVQGVLGDLDGYVGIGASQKPAVFSVIGDIGVLSGAVHITAPRPPAMVSVLGAIGDLEGYCGLIYDSQTARPLVSRFEGRWQDAKASSHGITESWQNSSKRRVGADVVWRGAAPSRAALEARWQDGKRYAQRVAMTYQRAAPMNTALVSIFTDALRIRALRHDSYQQALQLRGGLMGRFQEALRLRNWAADAFQQALPLSQGVMDRATSALRSGVLWAGRYQQAIVPPAGIYLRPTEPPGGEPCYVPNANLVFAQAWSAIPNLVFVCEKHGTTPPEPGETVVVPVRRVYMTMNAISLRRVAGNIELPAAGFSMSIDADSWTWSWSASMPADARQYLVPDAGGNPIELEASINGVAYRLCAEGMSRDRRFASSRIAVRGRGLAAALDSPYAPTLNFGNAQARTAQQLMLDALTVNGVGMGWEVDWGLTDWLVPGGIWSFQGSYIAAINAIAAAAGGYVQPHNTAKTLRILPRYPHVPWEWSSVTPDYELPADVVAIEGIEWLKKPDYNRVHVSGVAGGVLGEVTRTGTAGDLSAPMVTDSLITHADAARQRGIEALSDTGAQANVSLKLPVLAETGIIIPGKFVRYADGSVLRTGLVRSTSLDWSAPTLRQTIGLETHGTA